MNLQDHYSKGMALLKLEASQCPAWDKVELYLNELLQWNQRLNLTAITDPGEAIEKHFLDCLALLPYLPKEGRILDIGSGGGFPGLVIKMARPDLNVTLVEAREKKTHFLRHMARQLEIKEGLQIEAHHLDPEKPIQEIGLFDMILTRATFQIQDFLDIANSYRAKKGQLIMMRGPSDPQDLKTPPTQTISYKLPYSQASHSLWIW